MNVEARLIEKIGPVGGKLHTARSRNDQVALDMRLYLRDEIDGDPRLPRRAASRRCSTRPRPTSTSSCPATPTCRPPSRSSSPTTCWPTWRCSPATAAAWQDCAARLNVLPLGAGALAGTTFPIDREWVAEQLGFDGVTRNSLDSVSDRDFAIEFCASPPRS